MSLVMGVRRTAVSRNQAAITPKTNAELELVAVGDICIGRTPTIERDLLDEFERADVLVGNLETPLLNEYGERADKPSTHRAPEAMAGELQALGIRAVSLANNHILDFGVSGLLATQSALHAAGVLSFGAGSDLAAALRPATLEARGRRIALVGFATTLPAGYAAGETSAGVAPIRVTTEYQLDPGVLAEQPGSAPFILTHTLEADMEAATSAIRAARRDHDLVIVVLHWGVSPEWLPPLQGSLAEYQRPLGLMLASAGADLVVGSHAHAVHGIDLFNGCPIAYGTGDFIFHTLHEGRWDMRRAGPDYGPLLRRLRAGPRYGLALRARWDAANALRSCEALLLELDSRGEPRIAGGDNAAAVARAIASESSCVLAVQQDGHITLDATGRERTRYNAARQAMR